MQGRGGKQEERNKNIKRGGGRKRLVAYAAKKGEGGLRKELKRHPTRKRFDRRDLRCTISDCEARGNEEKHRGEDAGLIRKGVRGREQETKERVLMLQKSKTCNGALKNKGLILRDKGSLRGAFREVWRFWKGKRLDMRSKKGESWKAWVLAEGA